MKHLAAPLLLALLSLNCHASETSAVPPATGESRESLSGPFRSGTSWNVELEGGVVSAEPGYLGDIRLQLGALWVNEPRFLTLGVFGDRAFGLGNSVGLIGGVTDSMSGTWAQLGVVRDEYARPGFLAAVGWSLFGLEVQRRFQSAELARTDWQGELKLRLPIGIILFLVQPRA